MHRFRKKSDTKRSELSAAGFGFASNSQPIPFPIVTQQVQVHPPPELPTLPPASDFRTSLILPDLSRRFTLLRSSTGNPVTLEDLRNRFAQQRAKGKGTQISEEEEEMLLDMLSRIRAHGAGLGSVSSKVSSGSDAGSSYVASDPSSASVSSSEVASSTSSTVRQSTQSTTTMSSSVGYDASLGSVSPSGRGSKRHSNNLFGSQFRDMRYMRKTSNRTIGSNRSILSSTPSESTTESTNALIDSYSDGLLRPVTPENGTPPGSTSSSPVDNRMPARRTALSHVSSVEDGLGPLTSPSSLRFSKQLTNGQMKRLSVSLEEVIKEIEEEADDQVLVPRSLPSTQQNGNAILSESSKAFALTTDDNDSNSPKAISEMSNGPPVADVDRPSSPGAYRSSSPYRAGGSTSPVPRVPGYIPGMPRPVTPAREADLDDVRSRSTTPRAASSSSYDRAAAATVPLSASASSLTRQTANTSPIPYSGRPGSPLTPLLAQKTQGGRVTPEDRHRNGVSSADRASPISHWRRPSSPLSSSSTAFQSLNGGSRPSTPSNVTWNVSGRTSGQSARALGRNGTLLGHSRNQSSASVGDNQESVNSMISESSKDIMRSPDSSYLSSFAEDNSGSDVRNNFFSNGSALPTSSLGYADQDSPSGSSNILGTTPSSGVDYLRSTPTTSAFGDFSNKHLLTPPTSPFAQKFSNNPLFISPMSNNSSRSSLVSVGSSYHSWEEGNDFGAGFINKPDRNEPAWHDVPGAAMTAADESLANQSRSGSRSHSTSDDPESILRQFTGLSKLDLLSIQGKLLEAAALRTKNVETRSPSTLRRRRPSTAQSIQSAGGQQSRTTSPAPQFSKYEVPWTPDNAAKANALLNSVVDSIRQPEREPERRDFGTEENGDTEVLAAPAPLGTSSLGTSSPRRRNKDLADILFGSVEDVPVPVLPELVQQPPQKQLEVREENIEEEEHEHASQDVSPDTPTADENASSSPVMEQRMGSPNPPVADPEDLMRQVQERTEAAMAQLQRSQQGKSPGPGPGITRKRVHLQDISGPLLVQSSTSINKLPAVSTSPVKSPQSDFQRTVKMSLSKRLRNTLKSKGSQPNGDEVTPWTNDYTSASFSNSPRAEHHSLTPSKISVLGPGSVTDLNAQPNGQPKFSNVSPPASAGPSLKGFMSRFRKKGQTDLENSQRNTSTSNTSSVTPSLLTPPVGRHSFSLPTSASLLSRRESISQGHANDASGPMAPSMSRQPTETPTIIAPASPPSLSPPSDPAALKQFYQAAQSLGLDQSALNEFLARSQPAASKGPEWSSSSATTTLTRSDSATARPFLETPRAFSPLIPEVYVDRPPADLSRSASRQYAGSPVSAAAPRRVRQIADAHANSRNTILRRTIIFPSANGSTQDVASLVRKTSTNRRRASGLSVQSNRSVHDRVPTPPPLKVKRQSIDPFPPVPNLPSSMSGSNQGALTPSPISRLTPETPLEKSNSLYDSFYDMYAGDRTGGVQSPELLEPLKTPPDEGLPEMEDGQALEVIELANGETIWSIVNGLRSDDAESFYPSRGSLDSEYSAMPPHDGDSEQLFFKDHTRTGSNSSNVSKFAKRKSQVAGRPETKVFYSSSTHIARLIEQLSSSTEAASFNIKPKQPAIPGHSHSGSQTTESDIQWTVEERLEHMLGSMNTEA